MHGVQDEAGHVLERRGIGLVHQQAELVAAQAAGQAAGLHHRAQDVGDRLQHAVADQVAVLVVDALEAVAVDQQQPLRGDPRRLPAFLQVKGQPAAVVQAGQLVGPHQFLGVVELVRGGVEVVQRRFQVVVAATQLPDQHLFVGDHAHDRAAQEERDAAGVVVHQLLEIGVPEFEQGQFRRGAGIGAAAMVADQQAQLAEELARAQVLDHQVLAEVEVDDAADDDEHGIAGIATAEQHLAGGDLALPAEPREQRELVGRQDRMHDFGHRHMSDAQLAIIGHDCSIVAGHSLSPTAPPSPGASAEG